MSIRLLFGSLDGKIAVIKALEHGSEYKLSVDLKEKYQSKTAVCSSLTWTINGKYAIGAITGKPKANPRTRVSTLVIWNSTEELLWTIPKGNEFELTANLLGLTVHPQIESLIVCGGTNGLIYLINIETCEILQSFRETGVWSHSAELTAEIIDCAFAPNGLEFVVTTVLGTLGFYGMLSVERFQATPVEQFFKSDYIEDEEEQNGREKKICNSRMLEYVHQPPLPGMIDEEYNERLKHFKAEAATYELLEAEILKAQPSNTEERNLLIDYEDAKQEEMQQDYESKSDIEDEDYVVNESQIGFSGEESDEDVQKKAKKSKKKQAQERLCIDDSISFSISEKEEAEYKLEDNGSMAPEGASCAFCEKNEATHTMLGPYTLIRSIDHKKVNNKHIWIHKECLINNDFIKVEDSDYIGIGEVIEKVLDDSPIQCGRCRLKGCTIKCSNCFIWFHGYNCCNNSGVFIEDQQIKDCFRYRCYECYGKYVIQQAKEFQVKRVPKKVYEKLSRDWIMKNEKYYVPQLYDRCYYFFQAHELFFKNYFAQLCRCEPESYPELPWKKLPELTSAPILCQVVNITYEFPDQKVICNNKQELKLNHPSIFMKLKLLIEETNETFEVLYTNQDSITEFLILKEVYENSKGWFKAKWENCRHLLSFHTEQNNIINVEGIDDIERNTFPETEWRSIIVKKESVSQGISSNLRGKRGNYEILRLSYWDLQQVAEEVKEQPHLDPNLAIEIKNIINEKLESSTDLYENFVDDPSTIKNFSNTIPLPMCYNFICERLESGYYRRAEAVVHDIRLIIENTKAFYSEINPTMINEVEKGAFEILSGIYKYAVDTSIKISEDIFDGAIAGNPKVTNGRIKRGRKREIKVRESEKRISERIANKRKEKIKKHLRKLKESGDNIIDSEN